MKRNLIRPMTLFGVLALTLVATVALTLSRATILGNGVGTLKCYDITGGIEKAC